jgi:hypothetical protein
MRINRKPPARQQAIALVAVMVLGSMLTLVLLAGSNRTSALKQELKMLETKQKVRLEKVRVSVNTNRINHGQSSRH